MNELVKTLPNFKKFSSYIDDVKAGTSPIMLSGLTDSGKIHFAYSTHFYTEKPICIITYNELQARKLIKDLKYFTDKIEYFPKREITNFDYASQSKEIINKRISTLNNIVNKKAKVIVTTIEAVSQKMIAKKDLYKNTLDFKVGETKDLEEIKEKLLSLGYERSDLVEGIGQYSIRGGILDVGTSEETGIRVELWGDEVDSIRTFSIRESKIRRDA